MKNWIDDAAKNAAFGYIRRSENGGMPSDIAEQTRELVEHMAELNYFSVAIGEAMIEQGLKLTRK